MAWPGCSVTMGSCGLADLDGMAAPSGPCTVATVQPHEVLTCESARSVSLLLVNVTVMRAGWPSKTSPKSTTAGEGCTKSGAGGTAELAAATGSDWAAAACDRPSAARSISGRRRDMACSPPGVAGGFAGRRSALVHSAGEVDLLDGFFGMLRLHDDLPGEEGVRDVAVAGDVDGVGHALLQRADAGREELRLARLDLHALDHVGHRRVAVRDGERARGRAVLLDQVEVDRALAARVVVVELDVRHHRAPRGELGPAHARSVDQDAHLVRGGADGPRPFPVHGDLARLALVVQHLELHAGRELLALVAALEAGDLPVALDVGRHLDGGLQHAGL